MAFNNFPYTDMQDLNIDWLLKSMKEAVATANSAKEIADNLKIFVETYFENLDVQQEINNKIDAMAASGELAETLDPIVADIVAAWLSEHLTPTNPPVDSSLTIAGAAADAKATGDLFKRTPYYKGIMTVGGESSPVDMNTFLTPGFYNVTVVNEYMQNYPSANPGKLFVLGAHTGNNILITQIVYTRVGDIPTMYLRTSTGSGVWGDWTQIANTDNIAAEVNAAMERALIYNGIAPAGTDLNNEVFPAVYNVNNVNNVANYPSSRTGKVIIFGNVSGNSVLTTQIVVDVENMVYTRISPGNGRWTDWRTQTRIEATPGLMESFPVSNPSNNYIFTDSVSDGASFLHDVAALYNRYDALMAAYPDYVSKETLGLDASGQYNLLCYTIEPYKNSGKPVVLFISSIHGDEPNAAASTYFMCKTLLEQWNNDPTLAMIFSNVCLKVVPLANPWGYQNSSRVNYNGVNLNRDYPVNWQYTATGRNKTGAVSMSQAETARIMNLVEANKNNCLLLINKHDTGWLSGHDDADHRYVGYFSTNDEGGFSVLDECGKAVDCVARATESSWLNVTSFPDFVRVLMFPTKSATTPGTLNLYSSYIGIPSTLMEMSIGSTSTNANRDDLCKLSVTTNMRTIGSYVINNETALSNMNQITKYGTYTGDGEGGRVPISYDPETGIWS